MTEPANHLPTRLPPLFSRTTPTLLLCLVAAFALAAPPLLSQGEPATPLTKGALQGWFEGAMEEHRAAFDLLNANYLNALQRLLESQTASARLETALQVQEEIKRFGDGTAIDEGLLRERMADSFPELRRLQSTYLNERARIANTQRHGVVEVLREYDRRLAVLQGELTRAGELQEALEVSEEREKLRDHPVLAEVEAAASRTGPTMEGLLSFIVKGEAELYHNGQKIAFRNHADHRLFVAGQTAPRVFRSGDHIVLHARSPFVNRGIVLGIKARDGSGEIAVKKERWRVMPGDTNPAQVTADQLKRSRNTADDGIFDVVGKPLWENFGLAQHDEGGSEWVQTAERVAWVVYGFVLTPEMFPRKN